MSYNYEYLELHAPGSAATCNICSKTIQKGEPRVGRRADNYRWFWIKWSHLKCLSSRNILGMFGLAMDLFKAACILSYHRIYLGFSLRRGNANNADHETSS